MEDLILASPMNGGELHLNLSGPGLEESLASAIFGEHLVLENTFIDNDNTPFIFKVIDQGGSSFYLDASQFGNFTFDQPIGGTINQANNLTLEVIPNISSQQFQQPFAKEINTPIVREITTEAPSIHPIPTTTTVLHPVPSNLVQNQNKLAPPPTQPLARPNNQPRTVRNRVKTITTTAQVNVNSTSCIVTNPQSKTQTALANTSQSCNSTSASHSANIMEQTLLAKPARGDGPFRCTICQKEFAKWPSFRKHKSEHLDEKSFHCRLCPSSFNFESNLKLHGMLHEAEVSGCLQCQVCSTKLSRFASLKSHLRIHEKEENLLCVECGDEFPTKGRLEAHIEEHKTRTQQCMLHRCRLCGKSFARAALLKDHAKEHVAVRKELKIMNSRKRKIRPSISGALQLARNRAEGKKSRACHICGKHFEKPSQLQRHIRVHTGEKPFGCKHCGRTFNQKGTLDSHILATHDKLKPYICQLCSCKFSQRGNLKAHMLKVHVPPGENESAFKCLECSCVYRRLATLNNHIAKVHAVHSYPRGLISTSKNAPKLISANNSNTTGQNAQLLDITKLISSASRTPSQTQGAGNSKDPKFQAHSLPNAQATPSVRPTGVIRKEVQPTSTQFPKSVSQQGPFAEVKLLHNDQGKPGSCLVKIKKVGEQKWHLCTSCSKAFRKPSDLIRHTRVHTQEKPYTCYICDKGFAVNSTLKQHLRTHMETKDLECQTCNRKFSMLANLKAHERLHSGAKPFPCLQCGKCFRTSGQRRCHAKTHTKNPLGLSGKRKLLRIGEAQPHVQLPDPLKITEDGLVPVVNRTRGAADLSDGKPRNYKCKHCPKCFKKSSHLKQHTRTHTGEKPYQCFQCQRSFVSSGVLKNHIKTHEGVRAFQCPTCKLSFTTNGSLTRHIATHSTVRNFMCPHCQKKFKTSVACRKHIKTHRKEIMAMSMNSSAGNSIVQKRLTTIQTGKESVTVITNATSFPQGIDASHVPSQTQSIQNYDGLPPSNFTDDDFLTGFALEELSTNNSSTCVSHLNNAINAPVQMSSGTLMGRTSESSAILTDPIHLQNIHSLPSMDNNLQIQQVQDSRGFVTLQYTMQTCRKCSTAVPAVPEDRGWRPRSGYRQQKFSGQSVPEDFGVFCIFCKSDTMSSSSQQINQNLFDQNGYGLTVDSLDLQNTNQFQMAQHMEQIPLPVSGSENSNQIQNFDYYNQEPSFPHRSQSKGSECVDPEAVAKTAEEQKIRESSRPISVKIYNELISQEEKTAEGRPVETTGVQSKLNQCVYCDRAFKKRSDLQRHLRIHTGEKPFKCHICSKTFRVKSTREVHMRVHTGGKSVSCHVCNNLFATKSSLRVHMRLHTNSKPYKCPHPNCERWFRTSGHRKAHIPSHFKQRRLTNSGLTKNTSATSVKTNSKETQSLKHSSKASSLAKLSPSAANINNPLPGPSVVTSNQSHQPLPPVHVIQGKPPPLGIGTISTQDELDNIAATLASASTTSDSNQIQLGNEIEENAASLQMLNNIQLAMDGPTIQITGLELNALQLDELLQNVAIYIPGMNSMPSSSADMLGNNSSTNLLLSMIPAPTTTDPTAVELTKEQINMLMSSQQHSTPTFNLMNDISLSLLTSIQESNVPPRPPPPPPEPTMVNNASCIATNDLNLNNPNVSQYVINNNAMMSSTAVSTANPSHKFGAAKSFTDNRTCELCSKVFGKPSLLARHARVHTGEKPYRCKLCRKAFSQKSSLIAHSYVHTNEKPFPCPLCTFRTVQKAALKKHFVKAHPHENFLNAFYQQQQHNRNEEKVRQQSTSTIAISRTNQNEILGV